MTDYKNIEETVEQLVEMKLKKCKICKTEYISDAIIKERLKKDYSFTDESIILDIVEAVVEGMRETYEDLNYTKGFDCPCCKYENWGAK